MAKMVTRRSFGEKLRAELNSRNMGARALARMLAQQRGGTLEVRRREVLRWLQGATPLERNRHIVEDVLGLPRDSLKGDDEDEEPDPVVVPAQIDYDLLALAINRLEALR